MGLDDPKAASKGGVGHDVYTSTGWLLTRGMCTMFLEWCISSWSLYFHDALKHTMTMTLMVCVCVGVSFDVRLNSLINE